MNYKICFFLDEPIFKYQANYYSSSTWLLFILNFSKTISSPVTVFSPVKKINEIPSKLQIYRQNDCPLEFVDLPFYESFRSFVKLPFKCLFKQLVFVYKSINNFSHIIVRAPNVNIFFFNLLWFRFRRDSSKVHMVMSGNILTQANISKSSNKINLFIEKFIIFLISNSEGFLASRSRTLFLYGDELLRRFSSLHFPQKVITRTPLFFSSPSATLAKPFRNIPTIKILRVSSIIPSKDILLFIKSVHLIKKSFPNLNIKATIVGPHKDKKYLNVILSEMQKLNLNEYISLRGQIPFGPELFKIYKSHDVQFMTSSSEGIPRVLLEGDNFGLPLITTKVGGIPSFYIHDKNCLISECTPKSFCYQFERMINSPQLISNLIANQLRYCRNYNFSSIICQYLSAMKLS